MGQMTFNCVCVSLILNLTQNNFFSKENVIWEKKDKEGEIPARRLQLGIMSFPVIHTVPNQLQLRGAEIPPLISVELERAHFVHI